MDQGGLWVVNARIFEVRGFLCELGDWFRNITSVVIVELRSFIV